MSPYEEFVEKHSEKEIVAFLTKNFSVMGNNIVKHISENNSQMALIQTAQLLPAIEMLKLLDRKMNGVKSKIL